MPKLIQAKKKTKAAARAKLISISQRELDRLQSQDGLGPNQRALLKAARLKKYNKVQCKHRMHDGTGYDFLGLACILAGVEPEQLAPGVYVFGPKKLQGVMPPAVMHHYGFRSSDGQSDRGYQQDTITHLIDFAGLSMVKLATHIAGRPTRYFKKPL